jgi:hypothetical protein
MCCVSYELSSKVGGSIQPPFPFRYIVKCTAGETFRIELTSASSLNGVVPGAGLVSLLAMPADWRHVEPDRQISHAFPDSFSPARERINFRAVVCCRIGTSDDGIHDRPAHLHSASRAQLSVGAAGHTRRARSPDRRAVATRCAVRRDGGLKMGGRDSNPSARGHRGNRRVDGCRPRLDLTWRKVRSAGAARRYST